MKKFYTLSKAFLLLLLFLQTSNLTAQSQQYLHFDRVDDFIEVPNASQFVAGSEAVSMTGWFYTDELAYGQGMMGFRGGGTGQGEMYLIILNDGVVECRFINSDGFFEYVTPAFTILPEVWQHVAWVYDGSKVELFINGNAVGSTPASGTIDSQNKAFGIGKSIQGSFNFVYGGRMDEVTLWSKALTSADLQAMMADELVGNEDDLQLYYKFNQGVPGEDNTTITQIFSEVGDEDRSGNLINFSLMGNTSNFLGDLDDSFQAITFPAIPDKLVSDVPFELMAESSAGLPITYEIVSGPATVSGNTVTLDGTVGQVVVRASQPGNTQFDPADDVETSFMVLDPNTFVPVTEARNPLAGDVYVPNELDAVELAAITSIDFPALFSVDNVQFEIDGEMIAATNHGNNHYTAWWTPPAYGNYTMNIIAENNYGATSTESVTFDVVDDSAELSSNAGQEVWLNGDIAVLEFEAELPSYTGAFNQIVGQLDITCPTGGCDPWDRVSGVEVKGHNGEWYEIIRYITPYGVGCNSTIDLTDFMSLLQGKVTFRYYLGTQGNGFEYTLNLFYQEGTPEYKYSSVTKLWNETFPFGDPGNLEPVNDVIATYPSNAEASKIKLVSTGHGWGDNNTGNAAEFHNDTHRIYINDTPTFDQHNWNTCDPNPDNCSPQNGTWFFDRAGWCPGAIAPWFDFDMNSFVGSDPITIGYKFNPNYVDFCHPNNVNCESGVTCPNCDDGFNPHLIVSSYLISLGDSPLGGVVTDVDEVSNVTKFDVFPNPSSGIFEIELEADAAIESVRVMNNVGQAVRFEMLDNAFNKMTIDLKTVPTGIYFVEVKTKEGRGMQKVIIE